MYFRDHENLSIQLALQYDTISHLPSHAMHRPIIRSQPQYPHAFWHKESPPPAPLSIVPSPSCALALALAPHASSSSRHRQYHCRRVQLLTPLLRHRHHCCRALATMSPRAASPTRSHRIHPSSPFVSSQPVSSSRFQFQGLRIGLQKVSRGPVRHSFLSENMHLFLQ